MASVLCPKKTDISDATNILNGLDNVKSKLRTRLGAKIYAQAYNIIKGNLTKNKIQTK